MANDSIVEKLESGERARLIPVAGSRQKEAAAVSALLAVFRLVPDYAKEMLSGAGAPISTKSKMQVWTEVCFKKPKSARASLPRPDGLLVVNTGRREWTALIEGKIKGEQITSEQLEKYLDLAKEVGADAVITISNQFATTPQHHPTKIDRRKAKGIGLFHFSWISVLSNAQLVADSQTVADREQRIILEELIRFLQHEHSGVKAFDRTSSSWAEVCGMVQNAEALRKNDERLEEAIGDWYQLCRYLGLTLSTKIGKQVSVVLSRKHTNDPIARLDYHLSSLIASNILSEAFRIPNAAGDVTLDADFARRTISLSMKLDPPKDIVRPTAAINWLTRQLKKAAPKDVRVGCGWPRKTPDTSLSFEDALVDPNELVPDSVSDLPTQLEVKRVVDLAGRFRGAKTLIEETEAAFAAFYRDVGQHLSPWTPPPPKYKNQESAGKETRLAEVSAKASSSVGGPSHDIVKTDDSDSSEIVRGNNDL